MTSRVTATVACVVAVLALGACSNDSDTDDSASIDLSTETTDLRPEDTESTGSTEDTTTTAPAEVEGFDGQTASYDLARTALRTAAGAAPNGMPFELDIDTDDDRVFEIKVASNGAEIEVDIDITGERVVSTDSDDDPDDDVEKVAAASIDAVTALDRVEEMHPDARVEEIDIDRKDSGQIVWEIELRGANGEEIDIDIDANTGDVVDDD